MKNLDDEYKIFVFKVVHVEEGKYYSAIVEGLYKRVYGLNVWTRQRPFQHALLAFLTKDAALNFSPGNRETRKIFKAEAIRGKPFQLVSPAFNWKLTDKTEWMEPPDGTVFCHAIKLLEEIPIPILP